MVTPRSDGAPGDRFEFAETAGGVVPLPAASRPAAAARARAFHAAVLGAGKGQLNSPTEPVWVPARGERGPLVFFNATTFAAELDAPPTTRLYRLDPGAAAPRQAFAADAHTPSPSADGRRLAYVAPAPDGEHLWVADLDGDNARPIMTAPGRIEAIAWSPDDRRLLVCAAGPAADLSGKDGGGAIGDTSLSVEPQVFPGDEGGLWRTLHVVDVDAARARKLSPAGLNIWEAAWAGPDAVIAVASRHHSEGSWYDAELVLLPWAGGEARPLYKPRHQIGLVAGAPSGALVAFVETVCSDRGLVCGDLYLQSLDDEAPRRVDTDSVDVSSLSWRDDGTLHVAGLRGLETVVADIDVSTGAQQVLWSARDATCGRWHPFATPAGAGQSLIIREGAEQSPVLSLVGRDGRDLFAFTQTSARRPFEGVSMREVRWTAPDGLPIEGLLLRPEAAEGRLPVLMEVHGGPVLAHRPRWPGALRNAWLVGQGYSIFLPNPRGSCGRGLAFAAGVVGDMGGADANDLLSGLDHLVAEGLADPGRLAVTGSSYGGYMAAWLVTRTDRFRAAIAISPITNWYSQHGTSQIPRFDELFLGGRGSAQYHARSPVMFAEGATTPTLLLAGGLDRNTPEGQAREFHRALSEAGCSSELVVYPTGGHSLRSHPIAIDVAARVLDWLEAHAQPPGLQRET